MANRIRLGYRLEHYDEPKAMCVQFGVTLAQVVGSARNAGVTMARRAIALWLRDEKQLSYPAIGELLGRHHTTVMQLCGATRVLRTKGMGVE